jgi:diadenosine tetraphosphate (Ap4A) HIT family hydrolase
VPANAETLEFRRKFRLNELTIATLGQWVISVRPAQLTLGSMVVSTAEGELDFASLGTAAGPDLLRAFAVAEELATKRLGAVRLNIACLMMKDPIVHFHVLPRYDRTIHRYGATWEDTDWPGPPTFGPASTSDEVLFALVEDLRA